MYRSELICSLANISIILMSCKRLIPRARNRYPPILCRETRTGREEVIGNRTELELAVIGKPRDGGG